MHLESVQPKAASSARMISGCPFRTSSDVIKADLGLQLLSSRREIAKLKWQHRLHGLLAGRLERVLYDRVLLAPTRTRGRTRRMWSQVVGSIWGTLSHISQESLSLPRREFIQELCSALHERDHAALFRTLASKPELALYERIYEGARSKEYLQRDTRGQEAAQLRFQQRSGTSILRHHDSRLGTSPAMTQRTASAQIAVSRPGG